MTDTPSPIPQGYWQDAKGSLVPISKIKEIDKDRTKTVIGLCEAAKEESARLFAFKAVAMQSVADFVGRSLNDYGAKLGRDKGNVTLTTFDGRFKLIRQMQENISFDERLQAAKALIDECIQSWSKGSNAHIKVLINDAFQVDSAGKISIGRVLGLRKHKIDDAKWLSAMDAISDSIMVCSVKPHIRFYERDESGAYVPISLDVAGV
ncbi:MAG: hypothetical protein FD135_3631 [Comamonadaceae bacterium]|nr:MAG: hypothetical protein FD135_3631 [Comamonadaceae bacterium]